MLISINVNSCLTTRTRTPGHRVSFSLKLHNRIIGGEMCLPLVVLYSTSVNARPQTPRPLSLYYSGFVVVRVWTRDGSCPALSCCRYVQYLLLCLIGLATSENPVSVDAWWLVGWPSTTTTASSPPQPDLQCAVPPSPHLPIPVQ